jgi:hypothetical protein
LQAVDFDFAIISSLRIRLVGESAAQVANSKAGTTVARKIRSRAT